MLKSTKPILSPSWSPSTQVRKQNAHNFVAVDEPRGQVGPLREEPLCDRPVQLALPALLQPAQEALQQLPRRLHRRPGADVHPRGTAWWQFSRIRISPKKLPKNCPKIAQNIAQNIARETNVRLERQISAVQLPKLGQPSGISQTRTMLPSLAAWACLVQA